MQTPDANADAVATCNLDYFATGKCTCRPDPKEEAA